MSSSTQFCRTIRSERKDGSCQRKQLRGFKARRPSTGYRRIDTREATGGAYTVVNRQDIDVKGAVSGKIGRGKECEVVKVA